MSIYKNNISRIVIVITVLIATIFLFSSVASAEVIEKDLGVVVYTQAPKTWTIDVPQNFNKVEVATYSSGKIEANQYMGWNGYLKLNGQYVWKFVRFDSKLGGILYDYITGAEVMETAGRGKWLDVTSKISAGGNTVTFYHYTGGDGIGVKVRIYTTASTPTPTPTPSPTPTKTYTPTPTPTKTTTPVPTLTPATGASISLSGISSSYNAGDTLTATAYVKNTGGSSHTFPVGFSVRDPDGNWMDIPYKKITLYPGSGGYVYFTYNIPATGSGGQWLARTAVWDSETADGKLSTRYDYKEQTFVVLISLTTPKPTQTVAGRYTGEGPKTIEESVRINCEASNPSDVSLYKKSDEIGHLCVNNVVYNALRIKLKTVDPYGIPVSDVEVSKQIIDKAQIVMDIITGQFTGLIVGAALSAAGVPTVILNAMDVKDLIELPGKIQKLGEEEYVIIGKTDRGGLMETWVIENQETRFTAFEKLPAVFGSQTETDHSIQKLLRKYPWTGRVTVTASSPKTEEIRLKRGVSIVVIHGGSRDSEDIVSELQNFFRRESGVEIVPMTFETAESTQNLAKDKLLQESDVFIYILTNKDTAQAQIYYGDRFMPTLKNREIIDENKKKYSNEANGIVSYRVYESDNNLNGRNYYLIAGIGNKGLKSAFEAFKKGEWKTVVGPEPVPTPVKKPWWKIW